MIARNEEEMEIFTVSAICHVYTCVHVKLKAMHSKEVYRHVQCIYTCIYA